jgi:hypothetical protein
MGSKDFNQWIVLLLIIVGGYVRLTVYGDLKNSVAMSDTDSYESSSQADLSSWDAFTSYRPYTMNVIYNIFRPDTGYPPYKESIQETTTHRVIQEGYQNIATVQSVLSILAWGALAWILSLKLKNGWLKIPAAMTMLILGFTPQIADWDSVMSSESLSISLFILSFALLIWLAFEFYEHPEDTRRKILPAFLFCISIAFWMLTRDVNSYSLIVLTGFICCLYLFPRFRKSKVLPFIILLTFSLFLIGDVSAKHRPLWSKALMHVWDAEILRSPKNTNWFVERGMPAPGSAEYRRWFLEHSRSTYLQFLVAHPVYTTSKFFTDLNVAFSENMQPYFRANEIKARPVLILLGEFFNPRSAAVFSITVVLLLGIWACLLFQKSQTAFPWAWLFTWAFLTSVITIFLTIFGDTYGLVRHALSSTITFKLLMWMSLFIVLDLSSMARESSSAGTIAE